MHGWKNAFDAGEWGLGRMANSLVLGCDCLGEVTYLDAVGCTEKGKPFVLRNAICIHEEDYGILWKHVDMFSGRTEVRRSRRLVVSSISTVGNYEYGFYWYFYLDGTMQLEVKLTGIMSTMAVPPDAPRPRFASMVAPQLAAPFHQHLFNVRLDMEVDGPDNCVEEVDVVPSPPGPDNPMDNSFETVTTLFASERSACRRIDPSAKPHLEDREPRGLQQARVARRLQAIARSDTHAARGRRVERRSKGSFRNQQPVGHSFSPSGEKGSRRSPESTRRRRRPTQIHQPGPVARRRGRGRLVQLRRHAHTTTRGLARNARRVHGLLARSLRVLRPQSGSRRSSFRCVQRRGARSTLILLAARAHRSGSGTLQAGHAP